MKILPANIEQQIAQVDRQKSLIIGISSGLVALWCAYRVFWALYLSMTYSFVFGSLIFPVVLWGVVGVVAGVSHSPSSPTTRRPPVNPPNPDNQPLSDSRSPTRRPPAAGGPLKLARIAPPGRLSR